MRVYHFIDEHYGLENIRRRRLKIATLNDLNDPFELLGVGSPDSGVRRAFLATKNKLASNTGVLCFSRNWHNPVQWSHYADKHRGLCLGFDTPDEFLIHVKYRSKRLSSDLTRFEDEGAVGRAAMRDVLCTKYCHWRYEQEVREFVRLNERDVDTGLFFKPFSEDIALKEVIVGHRSTVTRFELLDALGDIASQVGTCKARPAFRTFRIVKQRNGKHWI